MTVSHVALPFPPPPREIRRALEQLRQAEEAGLPELRRNAVEL